MHYKSDINGQNHNFFYGSGGIMRGHRIKKILRCCKQGVSTIWFYNERVGAALEIDLRQAYRVKEMLEDNFKFCSKKAVVMMMHVIIWQKIR